MLAALAIASGLFSTLLLGTRGEARLRETEGNGTLAVDLEAVPYLRLETRSRSREFDLTFEYAIDLTLPDLEYAVPGGLQVFQLGALSAWYRAPHDWILGAAQGGTFGEMNFSYLTPYSVTPSQGTGGAQPPLQIAPCTGVITTCSTQVVTYGVSASALTAEYTRGRNTIVLTPSYSVSGGLDSQTRALAQLPVVSQPHFYFLFSHVLGRRDETSVLGDVTASDSTDRACNPENGGPPVDPKDPNPPLCAPRTQWAGLRATYRRRVTRRLTYEVTGGATVARTEIDPSQSYKLLPYPVAGVRVEYETGRSDRPAMHPLVTDPHTPSVYAYAIVQPVVDTFMGIVDPRLEIGAAMYQRLDYVRTLFAHAGFVRSLPPTALDTGYFVGDVQVLQRLDPYRFEAGFGVRGAYQNSPVYGEFYTLSAFLSFIWHEPRIGF